MQDTYERVLRQPISSCLGCMLQGAIKQQQQKKTKVMLGVVRKTEKTIKNEKGWK